MRPAPLRRALSALALAAAGLAPSPAVAVEQNGDGLDPHHPGSLLHGRVFHLPQGARLSWEAWEGDRGGHIREVAIDQEQLLDLERAGVQVPADRAGPGVALMRYVLTVHPDAPPDAILSVHVIGDAGEGGSGAHDHDWDFAFTVHVVRGDRYQMDPA